MTLTLAQAVRATRAGKGMVLLTPSAEGIRVRRETDGYTVEAHVPGKIDGTIEVKANLLARVLGWTQTPTLWADLSLKDDARLEIEDTASSYVIYGRSPYEIPEPLPGPTAVAIPFDVARFAWVAQDAARDDSRPALQGVCFNPKTGAFAASDGFRIRVAGEPWKPDGNSVVIPANLAGLLPRPCSVEIDREHGMATFNGEYTVQAALIQVPFPAFASKVQIHTPVEARPDYAAFKAGCIRMRNLYRDIGGFGDVRLYVEGGELRLAFAILGDVEAEMRLPCKHSADFHVAFNPEYLCHEVVSGPAVLRGTNDPLTQLLFDHEDGRVAALMPMFVDWPEGD